MKLVVLALFLTACSTPEPPPSLPSEGRAPAGGPRIAVASYNVNYGIAGDEGTLNAIADLDVDIVLLQETNAAWEAALRDRLGAAYPAMDFRHCCLAGGLGVLSRYPLRWRASSHPAGAWFPAARYDVDTPLGTLAVVNVHLRPNVSDDGGYLSGMIQTPAVRDREMRAHLDLLDPGAPPTIIGGDFNEAADGGAVRLLERRGFASANHLTGSASTWRWPTPLGDLTMQFDHLLVDHRLLLREARVVDAGRSDHLPVAAEIELRPPAPPKPLSTSG